MNKKYKVLLICLVVYLILIGIFGFIIVYNKTLPPNNIIIELINIIFKLDALVSGTSIFCICFVSLCTGVFSIFSFELFILMIIYYCIFNVNNFFNFLFFS